MPLCLMVFTAALLLSPVCVDEASEASGGVPAPESATPTASIREAAPLSAQRVWLGPDGAPLPFQTDEKILKFLKTAKICSTDPIPIGVADPRRVLLEKDGVQAHATFKEDVDYRQERVRLSDGSYIIELRDYYTYEYAAYEMSHLLGLDNVPPTVIRRVDRNVGSLQIWVEASMTELERREQGLRVPDLVSWIRQVLSMYLFDNLIGNLDRNLGDVVIDSAWKLWTIDHSSSFAVRFEPRNMEDIVVCERGVWERLQALDENQIDERLGDALTGRQISAMLDRRDILVAHIQALIDQRTEDAVIYDRQ